MQPKKLDDVQSTAETERVFSALQSKQIQNYYSNGIEFIPGILQNLIKK